MATPAKKLCADIVVDFLASHGITHVFDLNGGMIAFLEDAIARRKDIRCFPMHHEQASGFAAEGYARVSGNFGVAMATSGPGATNLMTAIGSAYFDSVPAMFITGQVHTDNIKKAASIRQEGFQETDIVAIVKPISKYAAIVLDPARVLYELEKAHFFMKAGRPGSVVLDIPINIQRTEVDEAALEHFLGSPEHEALLRAESTTSQIDPAIQEKLRKLQALLLSAKAPLIIAGNGVRVSGTMQELFDFATKNNLPVVSSLLGIDAYPAGDTYLGMIGSNGNRSANIAFANADCIIALGTRLDIRQTGDPKFFNKGAQVIHVDIEEQAIGYTIPVALPFVLDLATFFRAAKDIRTPAKSAWFAFIRAVEKEFERPLVYGKKNDANTLVREISLNTKPHTTILADVGQNQMWTAQSWVTKKGQRLLFSGGMGAMGFSLPAAVGAWCADRKRDLVVISGDGGLQINIQELETVARNKIPMKLFVMNNKSLGMTREFQELYFNGRYQSSVIGYGSPDLKKLAYAFGFAYARIASTKKKDPLIKKILAAKKPTIVEVVLDLTATLTPKIVYGHALDDQAPYLDSAQKAKLESLKAKLGAS